MSFNTYRNDKFLNPVYVERVMQKLNVGQLIAERHSIVRDIGDAGTVQWIEELYSDYGDPLRITSLDSIELKDASLFEHVKFSQIEIKTAAIKTFGIEIDFSNEVRRNRQLVEYIARRYKRAA